MEAGKTQYRLADQKTVTFGRHERKPGMNLRVFGLGFGFCSLLAGCAPVAQPAYPAASDAVSIDRFSAAAGKLQRRTPKNGLPGPNQPVDFDKPPFITQSRGPGGETIRYYNFDVQPTVAAAMYVFVGSDGKPVGGQRHIVDVIPGNAGYNDFFRLVEVTVPPGYVPNQIRDLDGIRRAGLPQRPTANLVNRPIVPHGSTAKERLHGPAEPEQGWYRGRTVEWLRFDETQLQAGPKEPVPTSPIYVTFNKNPDQPGGGPPSGFVTEPGGIQTHNVASSLPGDVDYSPLWMVSFYDNIAFPKVTNETTVLAAPFKAHNVATVNCPVVFIQPR